MNRPRLQPGDSVVLGGLSDDLLVIIRRIRNGWLVQSKGHDATREVADVDLIEANRNQRFRHWPCNLDGLEERIARKLQTGFDAWPAHCRRECLRRLTFVQAVERVRDAHANVLDACSAVVAEVWRENSDHWIEEERGAARDKARSARRLHGVDQDDDDRLIKMRSLKCPSPRTIRVWYSMWKTNGQTELALMPDYGKRGWHGPHFPVAKSEDEVDTYQLMEQAIKGSYLDLLKRSKQIAFEQYLKLCHAKNIAALSMRSFRRYIDRNFRQYDQYAQRHGKKAAFLRFGVFALRDLPDRPLEEVEIDHCLVDLIVVDENGKRLGRPWISVVLDRATKCIVGLHVSFSSPNHLTVQRAVAHAIYEKDLSAFPELENDWPCYGLMEWIISDRGKEFLSKSFRIACLLLNIYAIALPGRRPWLKGAVERVFRTVHARVFDHLEGSTKAWNPDTYNSVKRAEISYQQFNAMLAKWIVDDYHQRPHPALKRKFGQDMTPHQAWVTLVDRFSVRYPPSADHVYRLTGEIFDRKILRTGIHIKKQIYVDQVLLTRLAGTVGGLDKLWTFRRDRADLGRIWILEENVGWHEIRNSNYEVTNGVSEVQWQIWTREALDALDHTNRPSVDDMIAARERVEQARAKALGGKNLLTSALKWARYGDMGNTFTPIAGFGPQTLSAPPPASEQLALAGPLDNGGGAAAQGVAAQVEDAEWEEADLIDGTCEQKDHAQSINDLSLQMLKDMTE